MHGSFFVITNALSLELWHHRRIYNQERERKGKKKTCCRSSSQFFPYLPPPPFFSLPLTRRDDSPSKRLVTCCNEYYFLCLSLACMEQRQHEKDDSACVRINPSYVWLDLSVCLLYSCEFQLDSASFSSRSQTKEEDEKKKKNLKVGRRLSGLCIEYVMMCGHLLDHVTRETLADSNHP